ncbi:cation transporter [bacterium]|nr:MAG: cation transporter [bacterium]
MRDNPKEHRKQIRKVLLEVLFLNWLVAGAKIFYGLFTHCASITADGFHSLSDGASNIIGIIGINLAYRPKDKEHPYGHKKYETFFSLGIAASLLLVCFELIQEGIRRFRHPVIPSIDIGSFIVMVVTMSINILVMIYEYNRGKRLKSDILISDSMHTKADIFTSISVIIALVMIKMGYHMLDPIVVIMIALFIGHSVFEIIKESSRILCDWSPINVNQISDIVLGIEGVQACHKIRARGRNDDVHIDLHVQVSPDMHMDQAHQISYSIENELKRRVPGITDVVVHMEPRENI